MADLLGIWGYNQADGDEELVVSWRSSPRVYNSETEGWTSAGLNLTANTKAEYRTFLDQVFHVNGVNANYNYNGTNWSTTRNLNTSVIGKFIENYNVQLYLGNIVLAGTAYPSRMWFSDLPKADGSLTWGIESGSDLAQTAESAVVTSASATFITNNIKVGDKFTITDGDNTGQYIVKFIDSETQITLTETLANTDNTNSYWVGSNYVDIATDDGDVILGFGKNSNELLIFKRNSLHKYNSLGKELRQVKGAPGTTSRRSIVNLGEYTFYYYPEAGIYRYNGVSSELISDPVCDFINGITAANQTEIVAWVEKQKKVCFYIGDVTLRDGTSISNCVLVFNTSLNAWSTRSYPFVIKAATIWLENNIPNVYVGNEESQVHKIDTGTDFGGDPISFQLETHPIFPENSDTLVDFRRLRVYVDNGRDIQIMYKLVYRPTRDDRQWETDSSWFALKGSVRGTKAEFNFPEGSRACGVILKFIEISTSESFLLEKFSIYYSNPANI